MAKCDTNDYEEMSNETCCLMMSNEENDHSFDNEEHSDHNVEKEERFDHDSIDDDVDDIEENPVDRRTVIDWRILTINVMMTVNIFSMVMFFNDR